MLHAIQATAASPARVIAAEDWRMFLMAPQDVEREILRLHQYKKLHYEAAGSLLQLTLPNQTALEFAEGM